MYSISQLTQEIRSVVDARIQAKSEIHPDWITQEILNNHQNIDGYDSDFYLCVGRETIREQVRKQISRFKLTPEKSLNIDRQLVLPGYERLQIAYLVERDNEQVAVHIEKMDLAQFKAKIDELEAMMKGCSQHADELRRYVAEKFGPGQLSRAA